MYQSPFAGDHARDRSAGTADRFAGKAANPARPFLGASAWSFFLASLSREPAAAPPGGFHRSGQNFTWRSSRMRVRVVLELGRDATHLPPCQFFFKVAP